LDFSLSDEQKMWCRSVRDFAEKKLSPVVFMHDAMQAFPEGLMSDMKKLGLWGVTAPSEHGGSGGDVSDWALMLEEIGRIDGGLGITIIAHTNCLISVLLSGSGNLIGKYAAGLATGELVGAFALTEPDAGTHAGGITTTAKLSGECYILNGNKAFITNAGLADVYIVFARTSAGGSGGVSAFVVEEGTPGFSIGTMEDKMGVRTSVTGELVFDECEVPTANMICAENKALRELRDVFLTGRIGHSAIAVGTAQGAIEWGIRYINERPAFGRMLSDFQGIRWKLADMAVEVEAARLLVRQAADAKSRGRTHELETAYGKLFAGEMCLHVASEAVQLFGAHGYSRAFPVERFFRDAKMYSIGGGTSEIQRDIIAGILIDDK